MLMCCTVKNQQEWTSEYLQGEDTLQWLQSLI